MKSLSSPTLAHLTGETTTFDVCWKLARKDSVVMGFTSGVNDLSYSGVTYRAQTGVFPSNVQSSTGKGVDNLNIQSIIPPNGLGVISSTLISDTDLVNGIYDDAMVEVFLLNRADLTQDPIKLVTGFLGEVVLRRGGFEVEVRSLLQRASQIVGKTCSPTCRATLGDTDCGVSLGSYTFSGTVSAVTSASQFSTGSTGIVGKPAYYFAYGVVKFTSGNNNGKSLEVRNHDTNNPMLFTLVEPLSFTPAVGDTFTVVAGCDRTLATCKAKFSNVLRFRGEPYVPGTDAVLRIIRA